MSRYWEITGVASSGKTTIVGILARRGYFKEVMKGFPPRSRVKEVFFSTLVFPINALILLLGVPNSRRWEIVSIFKFMISRPVHKSSEPILLDQGFLHSWVSLSRSIDCYSRTSYKFVQPLLFWCLRKGLRHYRAIVYLRISFDEFNRRLSNRSKKHSTDTMSRCEKFMFYVSYSKKFDLVILNARELDIQVIDINTQLRAPEETADLILMR